jgi:hypothetical protein
VNHVVYDTNIASLAVEGRMPAALGTRLLGAVEVLAFKDFADFAEHHGLVLISD